MVKKVKFSELENLAIKEDSLGAGEVFGQALKNLPSSAFQFGKDVISPLLDPIGTAKSIAQLGAGVVQLAIPGEQANEKQAKLVGAYFANRYGGLENIKKTFAEDPVGFISDASIILTGGGTLATKVGPLTKIGEQAKKVGQAIDPLTGKITQTVVGKPLSAITGTLTGTGSEAIKEAYKAGAVGGERAKEFTQTLRGKSSLEDVVTDAKKGVKVMSEKRKSDYLRSMEGIKESQKVIDFDPIKNDIFNIRKKFEFKDTGQTKLDSNALNKLDEIEEAVNIWSKSKVFHTVEGLDALKQKIDNLMPEADTFGKTAGKSSAVVTDARTIISDKIKSISPDYAKTMSTYEEAINLEKEIRKSLSLGKNASADTSLRKLLSVMRNNTNTNFGNRLENLKKLENIGDVNLTPSLAGASLNPIMPRGLQGALFSPFAIGSGIAVSQGVNPVVLGLLGASSPRLVGEAAYLSGKALPLSPLSRQLGIAEREINPNQNTTLNVLSNIFDQ